jgi:tol-pal system protein YbgF
VTSIPVPRRGGASRRLPALAILAGAGTLLSGCYAPQLLRLQNGLDSLRVVVDTLEVRNQAAYEALSTTRRELTEQRDILLSTRATTGSTTKEVFDQMGRLESKLDEVMGRFQQISQRQSTPASPGAPDPNQIYDQANSDLTQGRYALALQGFREFLRAYPQSELADNALYGAGESWFAMSRFDSASVEYDRVVQEYPTGDRVPAALYKLALSQEKLGKASDARSTFEDLVKRFPNSGEAQLARERLGNTRRR